ncbi:8148_t:CDS:10 [Dentiscutata erythropus]|uniref:8148_t:CDS:1 n=1 Tax=Dentiscutata erythropus TaxID=1348616 RepID=A0A9N9NC55_9GLOM|nr:8148_t:CDS:10 [Dentiscutata erythropus]
MKKDSEYNEMEHEIKHAPFLIPKNPVYEFYGLKIAQVMEAMKFIQKRSQSSGLHDTLSVLLDTMGSININLPDAIELYTTYLKFEFIREKTLSNVEEFKQRWLENCMFFLHENKNSVFLSMVPQLLKFWPNIFVGTPQFIYIIASGINSAITIKIQGYRRRRRRRFYPWINNVNQTEKFMSTSVYLKSLDPLSAVWLLETVSPTVKIIEALFEIMISTTTDEARFEIINYINSTFHSWQKNETPAIDLMDDLWKKPHPALKRGLLSLQPKVKTIAASIGIQIKFSNLVEEISDDKHIELEENDDGIMAIPVLVYFQYQNNRRIASYVLRPCSLVTKIIVTSSEEEVKQPNNQKNRSSRAARYLAQRTTPQTSRHKSASSNIELPIEDGSTQNKTPRSRTRAVTAQTMSLRSTINTSQLSGGKRKSTIPTASWKKQPKVPEES